MLIEKYKLPNGVRVVVEHIPHVRSVAIGIWVKTGSRFETAQMNGMSHFIEHMVFKGTEKRSARHIAEAFDEIGGHVNAFTSKEYTCFYAKVLDEHTPVALDVLEDMFFNSTFDDGEMRKEKQVVIEEIRIGCTICRLKLQSQTIHSGIRFSVRSRMWAALNQTI